MISEQLNMDMHSLHIDTEKEMFKCTMKVLVSDTSVVTDLCKKLKKIDGILMVKRLND